MLSSPEQWHTSINTELECVPDVSIFLSFFFFLLCWVFIAGLRLSLAAVRRGYSSLQCVGFSAQWLLLVWSTGTRSQDSVVAAHGLSSCDPRAWFEEDAGIEPASSALSGGCLTIGLPGKSASVF